MEILIKSGKNKPKKSFSLKDLIILRNKHYFKKSKSFKFNNSSYYIYDGGEINQLFGLFSGFLNKNKLYFGWKPNNDLTKISIFICGNINESDYFRHHLLDININKWYDFEIEYFPAYESFNFSIFDGLTNRGYLTDITLSNPIIFCYLISHKFNDCNGIAPHDITINERKLKKNEKFYEYIINYLRNI